jgi:hypothetical protein
MLYPAKMLELNTEKRISAKDLLNSEIIKGVASPYFKEKKRMQLSMFVV